jgi:hypothetical protein
VNAWSEWTGEVPPGGEVVVVFVPPCDWRPGGFAFGGNFYRLDLVSLLIGTIEQIKGPIPLVALNGLRLDLDRCPCNVAIAARIRSERSVLPNRLCVRLNGEAEGS